MICTNEYRSLKPRQTGSNKRSRTNVTTNDSNTNFLRSRESSTSREPIFLEPHLETPQTFIPSYLPLVTAGNCALDKRTASTKAAQQRFRWLNPRRSSQPLVHVRAGLHDYPHLRMRFKNHSTGILALPQLNTS